MKWVSMTLPFCILLEIFGCQGQTNIDPVGSVMDSPTTPAKSENSLIYAQQVTNNQQLPNVEDQVGTPPSLGDIISFSRVFWALVFLLVGYLLIRGISKILEIFAERSTKYRITLKSLIPVVKILGWLGVTFLIVAGIFQPPAATILALSASVGVAVGFASQDILKNIFGGIMILFDRPFTTGDKIEVGGFYGEVVEIGLRSTRIITPDDNLVSIPNSEIMNKSVSNANAGEPNCQVVSEIYLPLNVDTTRVRSIAIQTAQVSRFVFLNKPITVIFVNEHKEKNSVLKMKIKAYVSDIRDEFRFKSDITENVLRSLIEEGLLETEKTNRI